MKAYHVRCLKEPFQRHILRQLPARLARVRIKGENLHPKGFGNFRRPLTDAPEADDPHCLPRQLCQRVVPKAPIGIIFPPSTVDRLTVVGGMVTELQQQCENILGHCRRSIGGYVADRDTASCRRLYVYYIITGS